MAIVLLFFIAIRALAAGYSFIVEPSGKGVGISTDYLKPTAPFKNYLIPGIVFFAGLNTECQVCKAGTFLR